MTRLFRKRYRVTLRPRFALGAEPLVLELEARTKAAARNHARLRHPELAVVAIEQLDGDDDDATRELTAIRRRVGAR